MAATRRLLEGTYEAFNARDVDRALSTMHSDVDWPNGMDGGRVHGHDAVREYWTRQWRSIDPHVTPVRFVAEDGGCIAVRSEEHTSELQSLRHLVCRLLLEKKKTKKIVSD